jgi:23S rRNA (uracil1939-C5)-methyltransferase
VLDATTEGIGIVSLGGKRVFVPGALAGETVRLRRVRSRSNYDEAELLEVLTPSPLRVEPRCAVFGRCGGCRLQHLAPAAQLAMRERALLDVLQRIGNVVPSRVLAAVSGEDFGYRRRARLAVRSVPGKGRVLVGFSERDSSRITDMVRCETLHPRLAPLPGEISVLVGSLSIARRIPQVEVAVADNATALVFRVLDEPTIADLGALRAFRDRHDFRVLLQRGGTDDIAPLDPGRDDADLWYEIPGAGVRLTFGPTDFIQVNAVVNQRMIAQALELLRLDAGMRVLDLFCGIGNFTLPLARHAGYVLGVEGVAAMVARATRNAHLNGIGNAGFRVADLAEPGLQTGGWPEAAGGFDAVLLDPPRAGAAALLPVLPATGARRILYVSCHPGTLARDAGVLVRDLGFELTAAGVLDMFPHTSHAESVALFERA